MIQTITLVLSVVFVVLCRAPIKARPSFFYVLAAFVACCGAYLTYNPAADGVLRVCAYVIQKGQVGFAFLTIVMFVGTLREGSTARKALQPIRGELSIMAAILMMAHCIPYVASYVGMLATIGSLRASIVASLGVAIVILALLTVLSITSLKVIKRAMSVDTWKKVQGLAYVFFVLVFFHLLGYLIVPAQSGSGETFSTLMFYSVIYLLYAFARIHRLVTDKRQRKQPQGNAG